MPELTEVRWLQENLRAHLTGAEIQWVRLLHHNLIPQRKTDDCYQLSLALTKRLRKHTFKEVDRRGKYLIWHLEPETSILLHMRFTGWYVPEWAEKATKWNFVHGMDLYHNPRMIIQTDRGRLLVKDNRCLSRFEIYKDADLAFSRLNRSKIGPDVDTPSGLKALFSGMRAVPKRRIRDVLLDQTLASGIGNYLTAEILHRVPLHGAELAGNLSLDQVKKLLRTIVEVIRLAEREEGYDWWAVFGKKETPDGYPVTREEWKGRGHYVSYFHQPPPPGWH